VVDSYDPIFHRLLITKRKSIFVPKKKKKKKLTKKRNHSGSSPTFFRVYLICLCMCAGISEPVSDEQAEIGAILTEAMALREKYVFHVPLILTKPETTVGRLPPSTNERIECVNGVYMVFADGSAPSSTLPTTSAPVSVGPSTPSDLNSNHHYAIPLPVIPAINGAQQYELVSRKMRPRKRRRRRRRE
jgi:hypothetical protein